MEPLTAKSERAAQGTRLTRELEDRAARTRQNAQLWRAVRAAVRLTDNLTPVSRGVYEAKPELVLALRQAVDQVRLALARHDEELRNGGRDD